MDLMGKTDAEVNTTTHGFQFSAVDMEDIEGNDLYTIANILVDETGSVDGFEDKLVQCIQTTVDACKKAPTSESLLMRVGKFGSHLPNGVEEIHGFNVLSNLNTNDYAGAIKPCGATPLLDATLDSIETIEAQAKILVDQEYMCNGIFFIITDGGENASKRTSTYKAVNEAFARIRKNEVLSSMQSILIGVNDTEYKDELEEFKDKCGIGEYISMGDVTPGKLAKLAQWVSQSISSTSQALTNGTPSQPIPAPSFSF